MTRRQGDAAAADALMTKACDELKSASHDAYQLAMLLTTNTPATVEQVCQHTTTIAEARAVFAALGERYPQSAEQYRQWIERFDTVPWYPRTIVRDLARTWD